MSEPLTTETVAAWLAQSPFIRFLNLTVDAVDEKAQSVTMTMPMRPEFERGAGSGQFHGGPIASFIDTVGDYAVAIVLKSGVPTINFRVDYLRPSVGSFLRGTAVVRRLGRTVAVVDIDVTDDQGRLCAIGRGTYSAQAG
ncbi:PaaI family thioesterase [Reyranella sp. CPCC 100927]|uniref:PaaI family thioesterase n=1 Tax=Reyranella sp. CPCC 100927 TaxID=2599616 RepID=UPI0011B4E2EE|nr:PaaI family thioesterase [Reyranella sp. CPCC 100927]TWT14892.1 PaaI family thioesterase [Reyranella sp. CPCC 100927]